MRSLPALDARAELPPHIAVHADVVEEIVALKNAVLFHHPMWEDDLPDIKDATS